MTDNPNNPTPQQMVMYSDQVQDERGLVKVSPDLIRRFTEKLPPGYVEGNISLRVDFADFKALLTATGDTILEITPETVEAGIAQAVREYREREGLE